MIRYEINHAVINDNQFKFWSSQGVNCWPTIMVFSPGAKPLFKITGEGNEEMIAAVLEEGLLKCVN